MLKLETKLTTNDKNRPSEPQYFQTYQPDWQKMESLAAKYSHLSHIVVVGNGGSINTFHGIYKALKVDHTPKVFLVDTNEPDFLNHVWNKIDPDKSLLLSISKSGANTSEIETTLFFHKIKYKIFLTSDHGALREIANKDKNIDVIKHPEVSGRFSGLLEVGLLPSLLAGFSAHEMVASLNSETSLEQAWQMSNILFDLENKGIADLFIFNYSKKYSGFNLLIQQLIHETWGQVSHGLTAIFLDAPEAQHHTAQRVLGGHKNACVCFITSEHQNTRLEVPSEFSDINMRTGKLLEFSNLDLAKSLEAEYKAMQKASDNYNVPNMTLQTSLIDAKTVGEFINFWQLVAYFGATLRNINPYEQPEVESIKDNSFKARFDHA